MGCGQLLRKQASVDTEDSVEARVEDWVRSSLTSLASLDSANFNCGPSPAQELCNQVHGPADVLEKVQEGVVCLFGTTKEANSGGGAAEIEREASEKPLLASGAATESDSLQAWMAGQSVAVSCVKARKPDSPNQDNVFLSRVNGFTFCGVADGHGEYGHWASSWVVEFVLFLWITKVSVAAKMPDDSTIRWIFNLTHEALMLRARSNDVDLSESGSTLTLCVLDHSQEMAVTAWVGDSRCVRGHGSGLIAESLSDDHKPQQHRERSRIITHGGRITSCGLVDLGNGPAFQSRNSAGTASTATGLSMSRSMGDALYQRVGVIHDPEIRRVALRDQSGEQTQFVLCCSDGVWEFVSNEEAVSLVGSFGRRNAEYAAETLLQRARLRWLQNLSGERTDDISVVVVWL